MKKQLSAYNMGGNKEVINSLQNINLTFQETAIDYLSIVSWLKDNIWLDKVKPLIVKVVTPENIDSAINRVINVLNGTGINGTLNIEKNIVNDVPSKTKVEVTLL